MTPDRLLIDCSRAGIKVEFVADGLKMKKSLTISQLTDLFNKLQYEEEKIVVEDVFDIPLGCFQIKKLRDDSMVYYLYLEKGTYSYTYHDTTFPFTPIPPTIWKIKVQENRVAGSSVIVTTSSLKEINVNTPTYQFPLGNVFSSTALCWGTQSIPHINSARDIEMIPRLFLNIVHNDHGANSQISQRELLEQIQMKDFPTHLLVERKEKLGTWMNK